MVDSNVSEKTIHLFESISTVLLFGLQMALNAVLFVGIMVIPILPYIWEMVSTANSQFASTIALYLYIMLFGVEFWAGRLIVFSGIVILLVALVQLLLNRRKGDELICSGLYSRMRHPQFTGIILITFGLSVILAIMGRYFSITRFDAMGYWLLSAFGYICIAKFEEWRLTRKLGDRFRKYKENVPFLFPLRVSKKVPDIVLTALIVVPLWAILMYFPFPHLPQFALRQDITIELSPFVLGVAIATWISPFLVATLVYFKKSKH
jgi:protein-S-isoprenylcysteine O-methyltransferase Ste14